MDLQNRLWVEAYRPKTLDGYVFADSYQREKVDFWLKEGNIPHLLMSGEPGTGKTTLAKILINELGINPLDVLEINASRENGVDVVRERITSFAQTIPFGKMKVVLLDEADYTSAAFQAALRNDMEAYHLTTRFILTCNYLQKIIPALKSRCTEFHIVSPDKTEFTARAATVLVEENIEFDLDLLDSYVRATYPDLRKCLNQLQVNSINGKLLAKEQAGASEDELLLEATSLMKSGKVIEARQQLMQYISLYPTRIEDVYVWTYKNVDLWAKTNEKKDQAIIIIRNGLAQLPLVGIPEIALAASLAELALL